MEGECRLEFQDWTLGFAWNFALGSWDFPPGCQGFFVVLGGLCVFVVNYFVDSQVLIRPKATRPAPPKRAVGIQAAAAGGRVPWYPSIMQAKWAR